MVTLFNGICSAQVETVDARAGNYGIYENCVNYGKCWGVMRYPVGLHVAVVMGGEVLPLRQAHEP